MPCTITQMLDTNQSFDMIHDFYITRRHSKGHNQLILKERFCTSQILRCALNMDVLFVKHKYMVFMELLYMHPLLVRKLPRNQLMISLYVIQ